MTDEAGVGRGRTRVKREGDGGRGRRRKGRKEWVMTEIAGSCFLSRID